MATPLTWRNVDAPSGGSSLEGLALAGRLLGNATSGLSDALGSYGKSQTDLADNAAVQAASQYQSAGALTDALQSGSLLNGLPGVDPSRVDAATMEAIQKGVGDRVNNDLHTQQISTEAAKALYDSARSQKTGYDLAQTQRGDTALAAIRPQIDEYSRQMSLGNKDAANAILANPTFSTMSRQVDPDTLQKLLTGGQTSYGKNITDAQGLFSYNKDVQDRQNTQQAQGVIQGLQGLNTDDQGMSVAISNLRLAPQVEALVRNGLNATKKWNVTPGPLGSGGVVGVAPAGGDSGNFTPASFAAAYGPVADQVSKKTGVDATTLLGQWGLETGWGRSTIPGTNNPGNIKSTDGTGVAARDNQTGSVDKYQQFATPESFGDNYANLLARNYRGSLNTGSDVGKFAAGLRPGQQGGYAQDPNYASKLIAAANMVSSARTGAPAPSVSLAPGEQDATSTTSSDAPVTAAISKAVLPTLDQIRSDASQAPTTAAELTADSQQRNAQNIAQTGISAADFLGATNDGSSVTDLGKKLTAKGQKYEGENSSQISRWIQQVVDASAIRHAQDSSVVELTPATAAQVLLHGNGVVKPGEFAGTGYLPTRLSHGESLDDDALQNVVGDINAGSVSKASGKTQAIQSAQSGLSNAQQALDTVTGQITQLRQNEALGYPAPDEVANRLAAMYQTALQRRNAARDKLASPANAKLGTQDAQATKSNAANTRIQDAARAADLIKIMTDPTRAPMYVGGM